MLRRLTRYAAYMTLKEHIRHSLTDQMGQSLAILLKPSVATFEHFERRGGINEALLYVLLAAIFAAFIAAFGSLIHPDLSFFGQFVSRLITIPIQFGIFTGVVYWIAKQFFRGTGTYAEVAYTFALFFVPLSLLSSALGWIPIIGFFAAYLLAWCSFTLATWQCNQV